MKEKEGTTEARERLLKAAEQLFAQKGYVGVTLRDIAAEVGIKHTSLYHHVPGGKEELFVEVTERMMQRHNNGLKKAMEEAGERVREQLYAAADWLLSEPPMDLVRMTYTDMPAITPEHARNLERRAYTAIIFPIEKMLERAKENGEIQHPNPGLIAGGVFGMIESLHAVPEVALEYGQNRSEMAHDLIDTLLDGLLTKERRERN